MATTTELAAGDPALLDAVRRARKLLNRRALAGAAASVVPIPGADWLVDAALLSRLIPAISSEFGLDPEQIERLPRRKREQVQKAVTVVGSMVIGRFVTRDLLINMAAAVGRRMTVKRAARTAAGRRAGSPCPPVRCGRRRPRSMRAARRRSAPASS